MKRRERVKRGEMKGRIRTSTGAKRGSQITHADLKSDVVDNS